MGIRLATTLFLFAAGLPASSPSTGIPEVKRAHALYWHTEYHESLLVLLPLATKDAAALRLIGQNYFMLGDYRKATEPLEKAAALAPDDPETALWLGRTYGRRAETSGPFNAPGWAAKAHQMLEMAVALRPQDREAIGDLFDYYLSAPGFLGGGESKARVLAAQVALHDPAEGHYYHALLDERHHHYEAAEEHFRAAVELAPDEPLRVMDLAKFLATRGRVEESEELFDRAERLSPNQPRIWFERASAYVRERRKMPEARRLLERYMQAPLTPNDPPRRQAEVLLKKLGA
ncbi:MAG TPA: tetratricopeptide repeat protein [Bryobacteraceae bacterium]|nr:tetratricopeptide repeat protein [Bryobacteraceae bacterium]